MSLLEGTLCLLKICLSVLDVLILEFGQYGFDPSNRLTRPLQVGKVCLCGTSCPVCILPCVFVVTLLEGGLGLLEVSLDVLDAFFIEPGENCSSPPNRLLRAVEMSPLVFHVLAGFLQARQNIGVAHFVTFSAMLSTNCF